MRIAYIGGGRIDGGESIGEFGGQSARTRAKQRGHGDQVFRFLGRVSPFLDEQQLGRLVEQLRRGGCQPCQGGYRVSMDLPHVCGIFANLV